MRRHLCTALLVAAFLSGCGPVTPKPESAGDFEVPESSSSPNAGDETRGAAKACSDAHPLDRALGTMGWGVDAEGVLGAYKAELDARYASEAAKLLDPSKQDKLRAQFEAQVERARQTLTPLDSASAGRLGASIVGPEFATDANESVLWIRDEVATRYFFFAGGALYKLVVAYLPEHLNEVTFDQFVAGISGRYGAPTDVVADSEEVVIRASWEDHCGNSLRADEKVKLFGTFVLAFASARTEEQRAPAHQKAYEARIAGRDVGHLNALTEENPDDPEHRNADTLVGETHVVLDHGLEEPTEDDGLTPEERAVKQLDGKKPKRARRSKLKKEEFKDLAPAEVDAEHFFIP